jgi:hypothetical protein
MGACLTGKILAQLIQGAEFKRQKSESERERDFDTPGNT